jgi:hypothetical protein
MGEHNSASKPYSLKTHPKSITLSAIINKEALDIIVNTTLSGACTSIF